MIELCSNLIPLICVICEICVRLFQIRVDLRFFLRDLLEPHFNMC